jgi:hypothetical protein
MKIEWILYGVLFVSVALLTWSIVSFFQPLPVQVQKDSSGNLLNTSSNFQVYSSESGCGNLTDPSNIQHLSHHPSMYADCLKQVNATLLQEATGRTLQQILGG